jgi:DNA-binding SARP family transcriptional activator
VRPPAAERRRLLAISGCGRQSVDVDGAQVGLTDEVVRARLLGSVDLRLGDRQLPALESGRAESLLAFLLLHRDAAQPRSHVAFVLWPDSSEHQAHTNLRKVLHILRGALPEADSLLNIGGRTLQWRPETPLWLDVAHFERAVEGGQFEDAVATYRGELLAGRHDEWLSEDRERLAGLYLVALERLAREHEQNRRWPEAIRCAERLTAHDPMREEAHRMLMRMCDASGDRARAIRAYHVCAATLERELGIEPSAQTRALYDSLVRTKPAISDQGRNGRPAAPATEGRPRPGMPPLVGRAVERARLISAWRSAASGRAQLVLVSGEPGVGKTRLVDELRPRAAGLVADARAYSAEGPLAYGIVSAWLTSEAVAARMGQLDRGDLTELGRLRPDLVRHVPPPEPLPDAELRRRLLGSATRALLAAGSPLLLVVDDAQWADPQSLGVVHYLLRAAPAAPLLVAATARREDVDDGHPLAVLATALQAAGRFSEIALERLDRTQTALLAERISGKPLPARELSRLYSATEGNPLFVVETLKPDAPEATKVQAVIAGRMAALSAGAARLAGLAAAVGREFTADVLAVASGLDEQAFVSALDELWRRGIIRAHGPNSYDFSHGRIRDAAYAALSPPRRRQAHLAVAQALEHGKGASAAALAAQYENAGATSEAIRWHARAADNAQWLHAHADAVRGLQRALELSDALPASPDTARLQLQLLTALPAPLLALEGHASARVDHVHQRAVLLADQLGREPEPPLIWSLALAALTRGDWKAGRDFGGRLRDRGQRDHDAVLLVESDYIRGIAAYWPGQLVQARRLFESAMRQFQPGNRRAHILRYGQDPELVVRLRLAHALWLLGRSGDADRHRQLALDAAAESSHTYSRAVAFVWAGILAIDRGDTAELRCHVEALDRLEMDQAPAQVALAMEMFAGYLDILDGRMVPGLARVRDVRQQVMVGQTPVPGLPGVVSRVLLGGYMIAGEPRAGLSLADDTLRMGRGAELWEAEIRRLRAAFLAATGAPADAVATELERALAVARRQRALAFEARIRETLTER